MNSEPSNVVKFYNGEQIPLELHKVRVVQKLHLVPVERRLEAAQEAGFNTFQLSTNDVYLDMLTDSGVNAMSDNQIAAMFRADDAYAGSQSFDRLKQAVWDVFGKEYLLPAHQGRACENIIARTFVKPGDVVPMNYHFTTTHAHIDLNGGKIEELGGRMTPSTRSAPTPSRATWTPPSCAAASPAMGRTKFPSCAWKPPPI